MALCNSYRSNNICNDFTLLLMKRILTIAFILVVQITNAQCAMCRAVVESGNASEAEGLNSGILYLMVFPYILMGVLLYFVIKYKRKGKI